MADVKLRGGLPCGKTVIGSFGKFFELLKNLFKQGLNANRKYLFDTTSLADIAVDYAASPPKPAANLYVLEADKSGKTDVSAPLQALLDTAGVTGGVVYLPAGRYLLNAPVTVPAGVSRALLERRGPRPGRLSLGTVIFAITASTRRSRHRTAQITLKNAGVRGLRIVSNNSTMRRWARCAPAPTPYGARATGFTPSTSPSRRLQRHRLPRV